MSKIRTSAEQSIAWSLGSGNLLFCHDFWLREPLIQYFPAQHSNLEIVSKYWLNGTWNRNALLEVLPASWVEQICNTPFIMGKKDTACWTISAQGNFTMKSAWNAIRQAKTTQQALGCLWNRCVTPSISISIWRILHSWLPC